jgi:phospholipid/cholesterol/gamma-HCH transport system substrate-binding protein/paraquat-inducible protein B
MDEQKKHWRLGIFVLVTLVVIFLLLLLMMGGNSLFKKSFVFETYFDDSVSGLAVGSPVEFRGVPLGQVTEIFSTSNLYEPDIPIDERHNYIVVRAEVSSAIDGEAQQLKQDVAEYVKRGLRAQTQLAGITGQQFLSLDLLDPQTQPPLEFDWEPEYFYVPSAPSMTGEIIANVQRFLASLNEARVQDLGQNLNTLIANLNSALGELPVKDIGVGVDDLVARLNDTFGYINGALASASLDETFKNIQSATARLDTLLAQPALQRTLDNAGMVTDALRQATENGELESMIRNIDQTAQRLDSMLGDNQYDIRALVQDLRATASNLRTLSENAKRYPAGTLIGGPPKKVEIPKE